MEDKALNTVMSSGNKNYYLNSLLVRMKESPSYNFIKRTNKKWKNKDGKTALNLATRLRNFELMEILSI